MKLNKRYLMGLLAGSLILGGTGAALAFGSGHGMGDCHRGSPMQALEQVEGLTDAQREQLGTLFSEQRQAMKAQMQAMRESRDALHQAMRDGASLNEIRSLATRQGEQLTAMIMARAEVREKLAGVLSEEQLKNLKPMWEQGGQGFERRHHW